jgi:hypothetical protein
MYRRGPICLPPELVRGEITNQGTTKRGTFALDIQQYTEFRPPLFEFSVGCRLRNV